VSRLLAIPAFAAAGLATFLFWRALGTPVALPDAPPGRLDCLSYTPFEQGEAGDGPPGWVSDARIAADLERLAPLAGCLRLYTPLGPAPRVLAAAEQRGLRVLLGAWIGSNLDQNEREVAAALALARRHPRAVAAVVVGNEVLLRRELQPRALAALIREVREQSPVPVAYADVAHFIRSAPEVAAAADLLLVHLLPYWDDPAPPPAGEAVTGVIEGYDGFRALFPGKEVMIGETGWPSRGRQRGPGKPSLVNEALFVRSFAAQAAARGIRYNLIEAIDQPWKRRPEGTVGGSWGLLDAARAPKFPLQGPVSARPGWRGDIALGLAVLALALGAAALRPAGGAAWAGRAALAAALGVALVMQWDYALATARGAGHWLAAAAWAGATVAAAAWLAGVPRDRALPMASLAPALRAQPSRWREPAVALGLLAAAVLVLAAWTGLVLAADPRHRDVPLARFALPALAVALRAGAGGREEAALGALVAATGLAQLERANPESLGWAALGLLVARPGLVALWRARPGSQAQQGGHGA
jgi:glucan 1,3-beta-glucosidase